MEPVLAYGTLAGTVALAVSRPRLGLRGLRITPGSAAVIGVVVLLLAGGLGPEDLLESARVQWRPLLTLTCVMIMTGVVIEAGVFDRVAAWIERRARVSTAGRAFTLVFGLATLTAALLNNDAAILLVTPLVVALTRRLYPGRPEVTVAFAFAVLLAPGVAPFVVSNPMNMIVAEAAGIGFNAYAATMLPISIAGAVVTYGVLRAVFRRALAVPAAPRSAPPLEAEVPVARPGQLPAAALLGAVFAAYPITAWLGGRIWMVALAGALASVLVAWRWQVAPVRKVLGHVSPDILLFLWGVFAVVAALRHVGVVGKLADVYAAAPAESGERLAIIGGVSALGSAVVDNHPMALLDLMALGTSGGPRPLLAALVGGDIGPRLLPIGSLAGLLWMDLLRKSGVKIETPTFVRVGALALVPTLVVSLALLWLLGP